ncbi:hypothetical protein [Sphaerospermopsis sp. LEGE 08334]|jgi:hypothetical protein|uniref:hypothetical protein n=1 Tax=Sphaerospermopsis sp. LEGE 08334 TaxID=1828651 RepID=UPI00187FCE47|nr:hypothetical protein [Sphaerospermopsis sp. LEGE 08334]MBE9056344.1 hypothetical protein [Sphaerospermopsis sp. LEGE 08334]
MLVRSERPSTNTSPFHFKGLCEEKGTGNREQVKTLPENNRERTFRRAANACEIAAGTCLNSTIIFTFHLLQVHPVGIFLAVGTCHFYFTATAVGEKSFPTAMVGAAGSLSVLCALSEPIGEWFEARTSVNRAVVEIERIYSSKNDLPDWSGGITIALIIFGVKLAVFRAVSKK